MIYHRILMPIALLCTPVIESANILVFTPMPWKSHIISFRPLFLELAQRGHNLTVVSRFSMRNPPPNYTQVVLDDEIRLDFNSMSDTLFTKKSNYFFLLKEVYLRATTDIPEPFVSAATVQKFINEDQSQFDLVFVESFYQECTVAMGHKYGAPVISIVPLSTWVTQSAHAANPCDFSYIRDFKLYSGISLDFKNRVSNTLYGLYGLIGEPLVYLPKLQNLTDTYFRYPGHENRPTLVQMLRNVSLSLINYDVMVFGSRPYVPSFIEVPGIHLWHTDKMSQKLRDFLDSANAGFVYFCFGSLINVGRLPKESLAIFLNVLGRLEQKVVFRWSGDNAQPFPSNFYVDSWLPQFEILKHPNCKLFITHGGTNGVMEAIEAGIPLIGFPIFTDQFQTLRISKDHGFAIESDIFELSEETLERDVKLVLTDRKFTDNAKRISSIFRDRPMSTMDKAVYWVEYVIRHKGAHHLRSPAVDLTWYQYYLLDVAAFLLSIAMLFVLTCYFIIKRIMRLIRRLLFRQKKEKSS